MTPFSKVVMIPQTKNFSIGATSFEEDSYESKRSLPFACYEVII